MQWSVSCAKYRWNVLIVKPGHSGVNYADDKDLQGPAHQNGDQSIERDPRKVWETWSRSETTLTFGVKDGGRSNSNKKLEGKVPWRNSSEWRLNQIEFTLFTTALISLWSQTGSWLQWFMPGAVRVVPGAKSMKEKLVFAWPLICVPSPNEVTETLSCLVRALNTKCLGSDAPLTMTRNYRLQK